MPHSHTVHIETKMRRATGQTFLLNFFLSFVKTVNDNQHWTPRHINSVFSLSLSPSPSLKPVRGSNSFLTSKLQICFLEQTSLKVHTGTVTHFTHFRHPFNKTASSHMNSYRQRKKKSKHLPHVVPPALPSPPFLMIQIGGNTILMCGHDLAFLSSSFLPNLPLHFLFGKHVGARSRCGVEVCWE